uniref:Colicin_E5 domain-containing protein n=1 Tax=Syphacia muris TaxID=451379 RepID=A0A0N5B1M7_9BILA
NRRTYEPDGVTPRFKNHSSAVINNPDAAAGYIGETSYFGYDRSGNLLSDGNTTYTYDGFGRTTEIRTADGSTQINRYDAEGLRAEMEENGELVKFLFNEEKEVIAEETNNEVIRYIRGLGIISSDSESARTYYHYVSDNQGSVRLILTDTTNDRKIRNYYYYDAFGESVIEHEDIHNRFRFNGEQYDPVTSQYYLRARYYNPVIGRFTQEDTYYGDGLNLYEYCRNNPVIYRDPSGHNICPAQLALYKQYIAAGMTPKQAYDQMRLDLGLSAKNPFTAGSEGGTVALKYTNITSQDIIFGSSTKSAQKLANQITNRGWTTNLVKQTVDAPYTTRASINKATGNPATVFYTQQGSYVIVDDVTKAIVQVSDNINPATWMPDPSIVNPYIPNEKYYNLNDFLRCLNSLDDETIKAEDYILTPYYIFKGKRMELYEWYRDRELPLRHGGASVRAPRPRRQEAAVPLQHVRQPHPAREPVGTPARVVGV